MTVTLHQTRPARMRDERLDKARIILIWLVVLGHMIELFLKANPIFDAAYLYIYSFHMPAFIMLAGMTSPATLSKKAVDSIWAKLIYPLLVFSVLYEGFHFALMGGFSEYISESAPYWILWFLLSLIFWRVSLPLLLKFRFPLLLSLVLAVTAGLIEPVDRTFSLSRTLYFLPFFVLGHTLYSGFYLGRLSINFDSLMARINLISALAFMLILAAVLYAMSPYMSVRMLYGSHPYSTFDSDMTYMMALRAALLVLSMLAALAFMRIASRLPKLPFILPQNTLWIYLWHGFAFVALAHYLKADIAAYTINAPLALCIIAACAPLAWLMCLALSRPFIAQGSDAIMRKIAARTNEAKTKRP